MSGQWDWAIRDNDIGVMAAGEDAPFCRLSTNEENYDEALARAKLVAAAPELLDALATLLEVHDALGAGKSYSATKARDAISKACAQ